jgi:hypothetical protein
MLTWRFGEGRQRHLDLSLVRGRVAQSTITFTGLLIALAIAVPNFTPGQFASAPGVASDAGSGRGIRDRRTC